MKVDTDVLIVDGSFSEGADGVPGGALMFDFGSGEPHDTAYCSSSNREGGV